MIQRIYGTAFESKKELKQHLFQLEEAKKRDHRVIGNELKLFTIKEDVGSGLILWLPNGSKIRHLIESLWKKTHFQEGYELLYTPHIGKSDLWKTSGHLDFYEENMYSNVSVDDQDYYIRPMNCPFHIFAYQNEHHSYRDLPIRYAELGTVYRYERSGVLHGLMRVRGFTQDDAHIICTPEQMNDEIERVLSFCLTMLKQFHFDKFKLYISTKPEEKSVGDNARWEAAQSALESTVKKMNLPYEIDEGGGAFYGPKIDIKISDAIGREWQCSTIQFDFNLPERFKMTYVDSDGQKAEPYMIHRALFGSLERFLGVLIEHYKGDFPVWLAPNQVSIICVNSNVDDYCKSIHDSLNRNHIRSTIISNSESLGYNIRQQIKTKTPYILVIGDQEQENQTITIRQKKDQNTTTLNEFIEKIQSECRSDLFENLDLLTL